MGMLSGLTLATLSRSSSTRDPVQARRTKFIHGAELQRLAVAAAESGSRFSAPNGKPVRVWFFQKLGRWYLQPRYGARTLKLDGTHNAIAVDSFAALDTVLELLVEAAKAGELDAALEDVSVRNLRAQHR